jgi:hypothetical protein
MLTTHPLPVPRLRRSRSYTSCHPNAPLWSVPGPLYLFSGGLLWDSPAIPVASQRVGVYDEVHKRGRRSAGWHLRRNVALTQAYRRSKKRLFTRHVSLINCCQKEAPVTITQFKIREIQKKVYCSRQIMQFHSYDRCLLSKEQSTLLWKTMFNTVYTEFALAATVSLS